MNKSIIFILFFFFWSPFALSSNSTACTIQRASTKSKDHGDLLQKAGKLAMATNCGCAMGSAKCALICVGGLVAEDYGGDLEDEAKERKDLAAQVGNTQNCPPIPCASGYVRDATGSCVPRNSTCSANLFRNSRGECVSETCPSGQIRISGSCRPMSCAENPSLPECNNNDDNLNIGDPRNFGGGDGPPLGNGDGLPPPPPENEDSCIKYNLECERDGDGNLETVTTPDGTTIYPPTPAGLGVTPEEFEETLGQVGSTIGQLKQKALTSLGLPESTLEEEDIEEIVIKNVSGGSNSFGKRKKNRSRNKRTNNTNSSNGDPNKANNKHSELFKKTIERSPQSLPFKAKTYGTDQIGDARDNIFKQVSRTYKQLSPQIEKINVEKE